MDNVSDMATAGTSPKNDVNNGWLDIMRLTQPPQIPQSMMPRPTDLRIRMIFTEDNLDVSLEVNENAEAVYACGY
jgi:hypothetical protein